MTTVDQLSKMPIGKKTGGFELSIKTFKKTWQVGNDWFQQVILMDETGEIPADVKVGKKYNPIRGRGVSIKIIVCEIQDAEYLGKDRRKLLIDQYSVPTMTVGEYEAEQEMQIAKWEREIEGKIRHGIVCSCIKAKFNLSEIPKHKPEIEALVKYIMTGE